ncbi:bifunctional phosphopantothenoylcysteine decarboxylase/phosphopantothenate--cysteine ligase CoaBC [Klugiella xanthotipulae]|uniref:Coenzyme A biosynthesis bifunctional protein CoaBC n=1 Tax=Klugiella xanthotipulae TaxID=244735 RepID=A0A543I4G5_9MICO|nr:bifunctional phosphopantothenoylcysteine decarboxylase/phosphopantothenate--cysteine ligase CoaBC [Klugiella xanthotipulae]TQM65454.1 phosphopantothenoylcysteine decarboxylase/phosphopantothenate--cysteine ligase [Klugiella xanthotipulae]
MTERLNIVVGITGGIAAYKAVGVIREFVVAGHNVNVIATESALRFVGAPTLEALSRNPLHTSLFEDVARVRHVSLGQSADLIVIAPATAHTLAKLAVGLADDLLGTTVLASTAPVVLAPAMHTEMWQNPATVANVATLRGRGMHCVGPERGELTGGDVGLGRMSEPADIVAYALAVLHPAGVVPSDDLAGRTVVVTAGGTREPLDPVRYLGNRSSGKQGVALAREAARRGARVRLIAAHVDGDMRDAAAVLTGVTVEDVSTADELARAVTAAASEADIVIMAAAVADYRPETVAEGKLKKDAVGESLTLTLVQTPDILAGLAAARRPGQVVVGFAAETAADRDELLARGRAKAARKGADLLVLNAVGWQHGFGADNTTVVVIRADGEIVAEASGSKDEAARAVFDAVGCLPTA